MSAGLPSKSTPIIYPDSDGQPMAENTLQYEWIVTIKGNLDRICVGERAAFVAGDNLIYPVEGHPEICKAPDVYVAFGRPRGHRGSYKVWEEGGVFPQVIFEILSPKNSRKEMEQKLVFYRDYGAEEYVVFDPDEKVLTIYERIGDRFALVNQPNGWVSPRLGIRFDLGDGDLVIAGPDGKRFLTYEELFDEADAVAAQAREAEERAKQAELDAKIADAQRKSAETKASAAETRAAKAEQERDRLMAKLRAAGIDTDSP
ncbi:MAG: Uma2 family endonuclease [Gemmataceae bacterium]|nr:Uma2 family endonuclease [Gemmataceae bacterium]